ncbi:growth/differentiation factor 8-like [Glandiceps talaboti]
MPYHTFDTKTIILIFLVAELLPFSVLSASLEPLGKKSIISDSGSVEADDIVSSFKKLEAALRTPNDSNLKAGDGDKESGHLQGSPDAIYSKYIDTEDAIDVQTFDNSEREYDEDERETEVDYDKDSNDPPCTDCAAKKRKLSMLSEDEITRLRIKHIKQQILDKLRLSQPPNITKNKFNLPKMLTEDDNDYYKDSYDMNIEEYYGKTSQVIILAETDKEKCHPKSPEGCFQFRLTNDVLSKSNTIVSAELWLYKITDSNTTPDPSIVIEELPLGHTRGVTKKINVKEISIKDGWITFDIKRALQRWQNHGHVAHSLIARCENCPDLSGDESPVVTDGEKRPFILINPSERRSRIRRNAQCVDGMSKCCMGRFYVDFEDINWHDWIIQPRGFYANYCNGSCDGTTFPRYHHTLVMVRARGARENGNRRDELTPCCSPTKMSALSLIYYNNDGYIITKTLPNMKVEACGCS